MSRYILTSIQCSLCSCAPARPATRTPIAKTSALSYWGFLSERTWVHLHVHVGVWVGAELAAPQADALPPMGLPGQPENKRSVLNFLRRKKGEEEEV